MRKGGFTLPWLLRCYCNTGAESSQRIAWGTRSVIRQMNDFGFWIGDSGLVVGESGLSNPKSQIVNRYTLYRRYILASKCSAIRGVIGLSSEVSDISIHWYPLARAVCTRACSIAAKTPYRQ
jgi:hypothetical protein